jgi:hypothetical protein
MHRHARRAVTLSLVLLCLWLWLSHARFQPAPAAVMPTEAGIGFRDLARRLRQLSALKWHSEIPSAPEPSATREFSVFSGEVRESGTHRGVAGAELTLMHQGMAFSTRTDAQGRFRLAVPLPGTYQVLSLLADGYRSRTVGPAWLGGQWIARAGQEVKDILLFMQPLITVQGQVVEANSHRPVAGAVVQVRRPSWEPEDPETSVLSDAQGAFRMKAYPSALIEAIHPYHESSGPERADPSRNVVITLRPRRDRPIPLGELAGRVVDPAGVGLEGVLVNLDAIVGDEFEYEHTLTAANGSFRFTRLRSTRYRVHAEMQGFVSAEANAVERGVSDLMLELRPGLHVTGVVRDPAGQPVPQFSLAAFRIDEGHESVPGVGVFDVAGRYTLGGLLPGKYRFLAISMGPEHLQGDVVVTVPLASDAQLDVQLGPSALADVYILRE